MPQNIYLMGFMSSGKTTIGKKLAKRMELDFIDLDSAIEVETKLTVAQIFESKGEAFFRLIETEMLKNLAKKKNKLIALGGGTACSAKNFEILKRSGNSIYFRLMPSILYGRLKENKQKRPLTANLSDVELKEFVNKTLAFREQYYLQADLKLNPTELKLNEIQEKINQLRKAE